MYYMTLQHCYWRQTYYLSITNTDRCKKLTRLGLTKPLNGFVLLLSLFCTVTFRSIPSHSVLLSTAYLNCSIPSVLSRYVVLHCVEMRCVVVLCCIVTYYVIYYVIYYLLHCVALCCAVLCSAVLCSVVQCCCCVGLCNILFCSVLSFPVPSRPVLFCPVLSCPVVSILSCPVLFCPVPYHPVRSSLLLFCSVDIYSNMFYSGSLRKLREK